MSCRARSVMKARSWACRFCSCCSRNFSASARCRSGKSRRRVLLLAMKMRQALGLLLLARRVGRGPFVVRLALEPQPQTAANPGRTGRRGPVLRAFVHRRLQHCQAMTEPVMKFARNPSVSPAHGRFAYSLPRPGRRRHPGHSHLPVLATRTSTRARARVRRTAASMALAAPNVRLERGGNPAVLVKPVPTLGRKRYRPPCSCCTGPVVAPVIATGDCPTGANSRPCWTVSITRPLFRGHRRTVLASGRIVTRVMPGGVDFDAGQTGYLGSKDALQVRLVREEGHEPVPSVT